MGDYVFYISLFGVPISQGRLSFKGDYLLNCVITVLDCCFEGLGLQLTLNTVVFFVHPAFDIDPAWQVSSIQKNMCILSMPHMSSHVRTLRGFITYFNHDMAKDSKSFY